MQIQVGYRNRLGTRKNSEAYTQYKRSFSTPYHPLLIVLEVINFGTQSRFLFYDRVELDVQHRRRYSGKCRAEERFLFPVQESIRNLRQIVDGEIRETTRQACLLRESKPYLRLSSRYPHVPVRQRLRCMVFRHFSRYLTYRSHVLVDQVRIQRRRRETVYQRKFNAYLLSCHVTCSFILKELNESSVVVYERQHDRSLLLFAGALVFPFAA